jgi:hypothetical protein
VLQHYVLTAARKEKPRQDGPTVANGCSYRGDILTLFVDVGCLRRMDLARNITACATGGWRRGSK